MIRTAEVCHSISGRVRLLVPSARSKSKVLSELCKNLMKFSPIQEIKMNPVTGSILIFYEGEFDHLQSFVEKNEILQFKKKFLPERAKDQHWSKKILDQFKEIDQKIQVATDGSWTLPVVVAMGLVGVGTLQIFRNQLFPPAWTLLGDAYEILTRVNQQNEREVNLLKRHI